MQLPTTVLAAAVAVLAWPLAANAHPGDHSGMALEMAAGHFVSSPVHLPALLFASAVFAGAIGVWLARNSARAGKHARK